MTSQLKKVASRAHEALWFLGLVASVWIAKSFLKPTLSDLATGFLLALGVIIIYLLLDEWRNDRAAKQFTWLFRTGEKAKGNDLYAVERSVQAESTVFLISPDMHNDARHSSTIEGVKHNLRRGVMYCYLTKDDDPVSKKNVDILHRNFSGHDDLVKVYVANQLFESLPTYNILILERDASGQCRVFVELPVLDRSETTMPRPYWAEADPRFADRWHERILSTLKNMTPLENPYASN